MKDYEVTVSGRVLQITHSQRKPVAVFATIWLSLTAYGLFTLTKGAPSASDLVFVLVMGVLVFGVSGVYMLSVGLQREQYEFDGEAQVVRRKFQTMFVPRVTEHALEEIEKWWCTEIEDVVGEDFFLLSISIKTGPSFQLAAAASEEKLTALSERIQALMSAQ